MVDRLGKELQDRLAKHVAHPVLFRGTSKPYVRWWWLSGPFTREDIRRQLLWVQANGFGGVEIAWLHPNWLENDDDTLRPAWLGQEWQDLVSFTKQQSTELGLGCDFTFGSCWPFGGSWLREEDRAQTFDGPSKQRVRCSWEQPRNAGTAVLNHLSSSALLRYSKTLFEALRDTLQGSPSALFCDSLELDTKRLWSAELWAAFEHRFGYSLRPLAAVVDSDADVRYDYRKFIAETMLHEFYETFAALCREQGGYARVQCHGAPVDLLRAYAAVDVPESESLLFPPAFSRIAASAAAWGGQPIVSAETFTCIYGFPGREEEAEEVWKEEKPGDLKLLADALFANGVNQIVWHGMPYQPSGREVEFYASVHVGPDSLLARELASCNAYLEQVSAILKLGRTYGGLGVYCPFEDALMLDRLPEEQRTPGANYHWEMRQAVPPVETAGYQPLWVSVAFLREATVEGDRVYSRSLSLPAIYVDCEWLDAEALEQLARLAGDGAHLIWKQSCRQPGRHKSDSYQAVLEQVRRARNTVSTMAETARPDPLLEGDDLPFYWARQLDDDLLLFFAHPNAKRIRYPMRHGLSSDSMPADRTVVVRWRGREVRLPLRFGPNESVIVLVEAGGAFEIRSTAGWLE